VSSYIEEHRKRFGVEPICRTLEVSASAYYERRTGRQSSRAIEDERLLARILLLFPRTAYQLRSSSV
jgi:putative transposase